MKYTIYIELSFDSKVEADKIMAFVNKAKSKVYKPTGNEGIDMISKCELWETHHDEVPPKQCKMLESLVL
jgi:hypothetical protein